MFGGSSDPIVNPKVPLDGNVIGALLGSYLRSDPENHAYIMPEFRLRQLLDVVMPKGSQFERNKIFHGTMVKAQLMEHIGILYCLCMFLLVSPNISSPYIFEVVKAVQCATCDALMMMNTDHKQQLEIHHPYTLFATPDHGTIESFRHGMHVCKDIIRDIVKQIRQSRETQVANSSVRDKFDCWQAHSVYFMCGLGLLHYGVVASSTKNINAVPGTMEIMLLIAILKPKPYHTPLEAVKFSKDESTRFYLCFEFLLRCAHCSVHKSFDARSLDELRMAKRRIMQVAIHPDCDFARLQLFELKSSFLGTPSQSLVEDAVSLKAARYSAESLISIGTEGSIPEWYKEKSAGAHSINLNAAPKGLDDISFISPLPAVAAAKPRVKVMYGDEFGAVDDWKPPADDTGNEEWRKKNIFAPKTLKKTPMKSSSASSMNETPAESGKTPTKKNKSIKKVEDPETIKEINAYWTLNKQLRPAYTSTRSLRRDLCIIDMISPDFHPKYRFKKRPFNFYSNPNGGIGSQSKQIAVKNIVSIYYNQYGGKQICPRHCNPGQGLFWLSSAMLEYVYQATFYGGGFNKESNAVTKRVQSDKLMANMQMASQGMKDGSGLTTSPQQKKKNTTALTSASPVKTKGGTGTSNRGKVSSFIASSEELDIFQRLKLVSKNAHISAKIDSMHGQSRNAKNMTDKNIKPRIKKLDRILRDGVVSMKSVATEQSELYAHDPADDYSDTDDSDDYTDTESEAESGSGEGDGEEGDSGEEEYDEGEQEEEKEEGNEEGNGTVGTALDRRSSKASSASSRSRASVNSKTSKTSRNSDGRFFLDATDPFVQLDLMRLDNTNDKGQVMGDINNVDPLQFFMTQPILKQINKFRKRLKTNGLVEMGKSNFLISDCRTVSVVWTPEIEDKGKDVAAQMGLGKLSKTEQAKQYVEDIRKTQKQRAEDQANAIKELEDIQEMEVSKSRAFRSGNLFEEREHRRLTKLAEAAIVANKQEEKKRELKDSSMEIKHAAKVKLEMETAERARIADIVNWKKRQLDDEKMEDDERKAMENIRLRKMESEKVYQEILRSNREEARMKYLEERRRFAENKDQYLEAAQHTILKGKRLEWKKEIISMHTRIRDGNFHAIDDVGTIGFYDDIRPSAVDWIQYEDESGVSYYYDPILKKTSYDLPHGAGVHHHTVDDRIAYDAINGEGTYDAHIYNEQMIKSVNEYGGFFNTEGTWEEVNGFYDEDGRFWDLNKGYFDAQNNWTLYPEVTGTLDFMV